MNKLLSHINSFETYVKDKDIINPEVSKSTVGWHIEHSMLTINKIIERLETTNPGNYKPKFSFSKIFVFTTGKIPRGKAKAPGIVIPGSYDENTLVQHIHKTKENLDKLKHLKPLQYFEHPYFGHLRKNDTVRFLEIHTFHHLKIIKDIAAWQIQ